MCGKPLWTYSDVEDASQTFELKIKLWQAKQDENVVLHIIMKWCPCGRS